MSSPKSFGTLIAAAALAMLANEAGAKDTKPAPKKVAKGECHGINSCKGKGECGGPSWDCAGNNTCKGQGWVTKTEEDCKKLGGKFKSDS